MQSFNFKTIINMLIKLFLSECLFFYDHRLNVDFDEIVLQNAHLKFIASYEPLHRKYSWIKREKNGRTKLQRTTVNGTFNVFDRDVLQPQISKTLLPFGRRAFFSPVYFTFLTTATSVQKPICMSILYLLQ